MQAIQIRKSNDYIIIESSSSPSLSAPSGQWINVGNCKMPKCIEKGVIYKFSFLLGERHTGFYSQRLSEFSLHFFQKWASIGWLNTPLAKTLTPYPRCFNRMTFFGKLSSVFVNHRDIFVISIISILTEEEAEDRNSTLPSTWASFCPWGLGRGKNESVRGRMLFFWNTQRERLQRRDGILKFCPPTASLINNCQTYWVLFG